MTLRLSVDCPGIEPVGHLALALALAGVEKRVDAPALRILPGGEGDAGGGADGGVDVEVCETTAAGGETVDVRRIHKRVAERRRIAVAHVVDEDDEHVRVPRGSGGGLRENGEGRECDEEQRKQEAFFRFHFCLGKTWWLPAHCRQAAVSSATFSGWEEARFPSSVGSRSRW